MQKQKVENKKGDSITYLIQKIKTTQLSTSEKSTLLHKAFEYRQKSPKQVVSSRKLNDIAYESHKNGDSILFIKSANSAMKHAVQMKDTNNIADMHWIYGAFHLKNLSYDSSYYHYQKARKLFNNKGNTYLAARMQYNMAFILCRLRDYTGAEVYLFQAIEIFTALNKNKQLYQCYNLLGIVYEELEEFQKSISYHNKALKHLEKLKDKSFFLQDSYNNIGLIYQKQGDYNQSISYFEKALKTQGLRARDPILYARLTDNKAYSKYKINDNHMLPKAFYEALHIRDSMQDILGVIMSRFHLAEYYAKQKDTSMALNQARKAHFLSKKIKNNRDILESLELLALLDSKNKGTFLKQYISLNKTFQTQERHTRNKFMRIQYETDQYIARNKELSARVAWVFLTGTILIMCIILVFFILRQRSKTKLLVLESNQQNANEQIYRLTLQKQEKLQLGRNQERIRIAEDLHDSILSDLFALRMAWSYLNVEDKNKGAQKHQTYLNELQDIERKIRELSHELKHNLIEHPIDFIALVENLMVKRSHLGKFKYAFYHDDEIPWEQVDNFIKVNLYQIIEECLQNCLKHAEASLFSLAFTQRKSRLILKVSDDGKGQTKIKKSGIGLKNIASRTKKMNGTYQLKSIPKKGTHITISIPLKPRNL
ncbi:tetratricopeptide repeat protein [Tamlana sp. 2_MG-2023]|uniref:tetratricopeptide repeat-containing sensor histidine kinase n=1 Tax=unclassified Tamlana TaxID=2614803 RepID=UPI0026E3DC13|nr:MULTISPECIES: tetratricopeptide repeat-containing sensor histidine kinase [unclassified Tamlana]MDO6761885.1 tetratricopeptide repeat protein [Tamlana sp. 2_MG-2023]MDO6792647.1 tetratricopeptide repeat protein [Tamlana sp. 1_MG-2023]